LKNINSPNKFAFLTWENSYEYRNCMFLLLQSLEPMNSSAYTVLFDELEHFNEVLFICKGIVRVGYEINSKKKFILKYSGSFGIGLFGATFNVPSLYIYKTFTRCEGYFIRKKTWRLIIDGYMHVSNELR